MRKRILSVLSAATLAAAFVASSVSAQAAEIKVRIPFGFTVNGAALPPGTYTVSTEHMALFVRGFDHGAFALGTRLESAKNTDAKVVFEKYGDQYFLREAWMGGGVGRELPRPRLDRERSKAARNGQVERITIPAL